MENTPSPNPQPSPKQYTFFTVKKSKQQNNRQHKIQHIIVHCEGFFPQLKGWKGIIILFSNVFKNLLLKRN